MLRDRSELDVLNSLDLRGSAFEVISGGDRRSYELVDLLAPGKVGVCWRARDNRSRDVAVKFVLKKEYVSHSLDAEAERIDRLPPDLFASIQFFGEPTRLPNATSIYAIAVDYVEGSTLREYIKDHPSVTPETFLLMAKDLCSALQALRSESLCHGDLHAGNIMVCRRREQLTGQEWSRIRIIDTGHLKTDERRLTLIDSLTHALATLKGLSPSDETLRRIVATERTIARFRRTDQHWVLKHLCDLFNAMRIGASLDRAGQRFVWALPMALQRLLDAEESHLVDGRRIYEELRRVWQGAHGTSSGMTSPFDLASAELMRSDRQLMALFSESYPRLDAVRSVDPTYLYGPRGCGKSTILRSLSLRAILESANPTEELAKAPFVGVYISASQELRSRFWLMSHDDIERLEGHVVRYFNLLLVESLIETFDHLLHHNGASLPLSLDPSTSESCASLIRKHLGLENVLTQFWGSSPFQVLLAQVRKEKHSLWLAILDRATPAKRPDAQLIFDITRSLEQQWPQLATYRLVFLIDDYSSQRIPAELQRRLNQSITFSKQGSPIFKVTSEYDGVDLDGVQAGREVHEINVGFEYVSLQGKNRYSFLQNVLQRRFAYMDTAIDLTSVLPPSELDAASGLARAIRQAHDNGQKFYYSGLDTIADLCSGDFAMGIELVRRIFDAAQIDWRTPSRIDAATQHQVIHHYAEHEFEYIRYISRDGRLKYEIADRLCWLSKECVIRKDAKRGGTPIPVVKNHIDISETAMRDLERDFPEKVPILRDLIGRGVIFPLQQSRSRQTGDATWRFMLRRILLARYGSALGRDQPIRIDDVQRLQCLLTEPAQFAESELRKTGSERQLDLFPPLLSGNEKRK
jgi:serine/threonine protein kinase